MGCLLRQVHRNKARSLNVRKTFANALAMQETYRSPQA